MPHLRMDHCEVGLKKKKKKQVFAIYFDVADEIIVIGRLFYMSPLGDGLYCDRKSKQLTMYNDGKEGSGRVKSRWIGQIRGYCMNFRELRDHISLIFGDNSAKSRG